MAYGPCTMRAMHYAKAMHHARHSKGLFVIIFCMCASMSIMKGGQRWEPHYEEVGGSSGVANWLNNRIFKCTIHERSRIHHWLRIPPARMKILSAEVRESRFGGQCRVLMGSFFSPKNKPQRISDRAWQTTPRNPGSRSVVGQTEPQA